MSTPPTSRPATLLASAYHAPSRRMTALGVIGHPSTLGGADTELDDQIRCWQAMGLEVHICPTTPLTHRLRALGLERRGCTYHAERDWASLEGLPCIAFCNGQFLAALPEIRRYARLTAFVNCMTWNFPLELEMQGRGLIDFHLYQTAHGLDRVGAPLSRRGRFRPQRVTPYFHADAFPFHEQRLADKFRFGRISRADPSKFGRQQLAIYEQFDSPRPKEACIVGWSERVQAHCKAKPPPFVRTFGEAEVLQQGFYAFAEALIMTTETFENLPRVGFEAMASGTLLIVDDRGGWQLQVENGRTGWLCGDPAAFVERASRAARDPEERDMMRRRARERLLQHWGLPAAMDSWDRVFREWEALAG